ncbi:MAG: imidazolonepropionase [Euryarchaeota archaeon]|nr:imidazolonepropionase [Euryarchaeota archaeon]
MSHVDIVVANASELLTMVGPDGETHGARRGAALGHVGVIEDGAVAIHDGRIVATGPSRDILASFDAGTLVDAKDGVVMPGFVDTHTHLVWAGSRAWELEWKLQGRTYREITEAGGGIPYTVKETRQADPDHLAALAAERARDALHHGTTALEAKSGYGLDELSELGQLEAIRMARGRIHQRLYATYLGAHERPPEHRDDPTPYLDEMRTSTLPKVAKRGLATFCDAFVEKGVYSPDEVRPLLIEAKRLGLKVRIHADEFNDLGGAAFAVDLGAASADHLLSISDDGIEALAGSDTVATLLPLVPYAIRDPTYAPARKMVERGCIVSLATDFNPNVPCLNMGFVVQQAVYAMGLAPAEALVAATVNAGHSLDPEAGLGVLAPGHPADLVVTDQATHVHLAYAFGRNHVRAVVAGGRHIPL